MNDHQTLYDRYIYANLTDQSFDQTSFGIFHRLNNAAAFVVGSISTALLLFMILRKSHTLQAYSKLLLLTVIIDFYYIASFFFLQARTKITAAYYIHVFTGPAILLDSSVQCYCMVLNYAPPLLDCVILPIIALYRHQHIKTKVPLTTKHLLSSFTVAIIPIIFSSILTVLDYCAAEQVVVDAAKFWYTETPLPSTLLVSSLKTNRYSSLGVVYRKVIIYSSFLLTVVILVASFRLMKRQSLMLSKKVKNLQATFTRILIAQAMIPIITLMLPVIVVTFLQMAKINYELSEWTIVLMTWAPALNSITNLLVIAPYRRHLSSIYSKFFSSTDSSTITVFTSST